jgi:translation elongation factor EF-1alpha
MSRTVAGLAPVILAGTAILGCGTKKQEPPLHFTVQHVFYIKPPVDRVMLVGKVDQGVVRKDDVVVVHTGANSLEAKVEGIERIQQGDTPAAYSGDQVALRVTGVSKDAVKPGDTITNHEGA